MAADEVVAQINRLSPGIHTAIVNTEAQRAASGGVHWVFLFWEKSLDISGDMQVEVAVYEPCARSMCTGLMRLLQEESAWHIREVECLGWQRDGWTCGYLALFAVFHASNTMVSCLDEINPVRMPDGFPKLALEMLKLYRAEKKSVTKFESVNRKRILEGRLVTVTRTITTKRESIRNTPFVKFDYDERCSLEC